jgi:hypothetical protein
MALHGDFFRACGAVQNGHPIASDVCRRYFVIDLVRDKQSDYEMKLSRGSAYIEFLKSRDESILLKIAPLVMVGLIPADLVSNLLPVLGIVDDVGLTGFSAIIVIKTILRVSKYRRVRQP